MLFLGACQSPAPKTVQAPEITPQAPPELPDESQLHIELETHSSPVKEPAKKPDNTKNQRSTLNIRRAQTTGNIQPAELSEVSGLAASIDHPGVLWTVNDSGQGAKLFAIGQRGELIGQWQVGVRNRDWEDLSVASVNGQAYVLVADIGDNLRNKQDHVVHFIREPTLSSSSLKLLVPEFSLRFRYPGRSHNSESLAVAGDWIIVLTKEPMLGKKRQASQVYRFPLNPAQQQTALAEFVTELPIPDVSFEANVIAALSGVDITQPTALSIDRNNTLAYVLTYRGVYRYEREANESWQTTFSKPRRKIHTHSLSQAEALAVDENGVVWFTSEKRPTPLWALPAKN